MRKVILTNDLLLVCNVKSSGQTKRFAVCEVLQHLFFAPAQTLFSTNVVFSYFEQTFDLDGGCFVAEEGDVAFVITKFDTDHTRVKRTIFSPFVSHVIHNYKRFRQRKPAVICRTQIMPNADRSALPRRGDARSLARRHSSAAGNNTSIARFVISWSSKRLNWFPLGLPFDASFVSTTVMVDVHRCSTLG
jgi:hypothetical protein